MMQAVILCGKNSRVL